MDSRSAKGSDFFLCDAAVSGPNLGLGPAAGIGLIRVAAVRGITAAGAWTAPPSVAKGSNTAAAGDGEAIGTADRGGWGAKGSKLAAAEGGAAPKAGAWPKGMPGCPPAAAGNVGLRGCTGMEEKASSGNAPLFEGAGPLMASRALTSILLLVLAVGAAAGAAEKLLQSSSAAAAGPVTGKAAEAGAAATGGMSRSDRRSMVDACTGAGAGDGVYVGGQESRQGPAGAATGMLEMAAEMAGLTLISLSFFLGFGAAAASAPKGSEVLGASGKAPSALRRSIRWRVASMGSESLRRGGCKGRVPRGKCCSVGWLQPAIQPWHVHLVLQ
jgi:hypothetical protein